ncbi:DUF1501 domain-containing protein [Tuwongella immobilis]|uniref:DUF1501 domain-containing protein n=1 Tax=Tuwongella immobilis TaxID=692036 RepID=A0A6C2YWE7_9BACT|nr:DUF1501 domain-containing protein [Tuwongella immobilis]VIP05784.1 hypothetical protein : Uncharacterized protein OS=Singulisphaera acidiphila (strain ATCC BAA-1392 / DSM 18658 / VKM B-2454 / MOB10) GN=Sinac_0149 PE=4 SV=1: DUF1501 [Tuwongella immobilis]VTS08924.1 hypothetical protein : Uncharacterized protein OS=Singulisphaera acidiphila (strain ATCC BAA-1392 / DSM 18658 / VKM B-2454 / MOB10) GN=Sinac_0149 PE=4 SV=1: DUF1501 [Tuwongella immobilis]
MHTNWNRTGLTSPMGRREFLRAGSLSLAGLTLPELLAARQSSPLHARPSRKPAKACILLFMWGGPAHQDTWDLKPDSPAIYRGESKPMATRVPGIQISEHLPKLAQRTDKLAIIRSLTHDNVDHITAPHYLLTGRDMTTRSQPRSDDFPNIGAVMAKLGRGTGPLPPNISMMPVVPNGAPRFVESTHGQDGGWMGPLMHPMRIDADGSKPDYRVGEFALREEISRSRMLERQALRQSLDAQIRRLESAPVLQAAGSHYDRAFTLLSRPEVTRAFDLTQEPISVRERYGMNIHGQSVLQARRLVEAGVPLVTVFWPNDGITNVSVYWDTHNRNFIDLKTRLCPVTDLAFSALLDDLEQRGMLDETLVVWTGEMGRTPKVGQSVVGGAGAGADGRDHWANVFCSVLAGGGIRGGVVHGSSDRYAAYPATNPTPPADLVATIYHCLGVPPETQIHDRLGRPLTLCEGRPIDAILG